MNACNPAPWRLNIISIGTNHWVDDDKIFSPTPLPVLFLAAAFRLRFLPLYFTPYSPTLPSLAVLLSMTLLLGNFLSFVLNYGRAIYFGIP